MPHTLLPDWDIKLTLRVGAGGDSPQRKKEIMNIIERVLSFFGLVTKERAKWASVELVASDQRALMQYANDDFGVEPVKNFEKKAREVAGDNFDKIISKKMGLVASEQEIASGFLDGSHEPIVEGYVVRNA